MKIKLVAIAALSVFLLTACKGGRETGTAAGNTDER